MYLQQVSHNFPFVRGERAAFIMKCSSAHNQLTQTRLYICVDLNSAIWLLEFKVATSHAKLHTNRKKWTRRLASDSIKEIRGFDRGYWDNRLLWKLESQSHEI